ncbi:MAG: hypothetical protein HQK79_22565 [Desulfobacterales bacterium]|nr:hypothetical protein [Desulfobacterales bacterium]
MLQESHDHNFKNLFLDFPKEALDWILPQALQQYGNIRQIEFLRQEPRKRKLSDSHFALDIPILFTFEYTQVLLWVVEFQEDKTKFSIYKLLHYVADMAEVHPKALVIPSVLFTDRKQWYKDVLRELDYKFINRVFLHFEYIFVKLFDLSAKNYYHSTNPLIKILLPKMNYSPEERWEVIGQAYKGLFQLTSPLLFEKYTDFIDIYANVSEEERDSLYQNLRDKKETAMLAQYIREQGRQEGRQEGRHEGRHEGRQEGRHEGTINMLCKQISKKYRVSPEMINAYLKNLNSDTLIELGEKIFEWDSFKQVQDWIKNRMN